MQQIYAHHKGPKLRQTHPAKARTPIFFMLLLLLASGTWQAEAQSGACPTPVFHPATNFDAGLGPTSITTGDFNGDGILDLVAANNGSVSILLATGSGFTLSGNFHTPDYASEVTTGDFNNDGSLDVAVSNRFANSASVLMGNGSGGLGAATDLAVGNIPLSIISGDFDASGSLDLAVANYSSRSISVLLGNGAGGFGAATNYPANGYPASITTVDLNGDGNLDLATSNVITNNAAVLLGNGAGGFGAATNYPVGDRPESITTADFNRDGIPDLALASRDLDVVSVLLGNGAGGFGTATNFAAGDEPYSITTADVNRDGISDLAVSGGDTYTVSVLLGDGAGGFGTPATFLVGLDPESITFGDFNGDGISDLATANNKSNNVSVLLNACVDSDGDGDPDPTDCAPNDSSIYHGAPEVCNGIDDNCNGQIDEGVQNTFYHDVDNDGYGNAADTVHACSAPAGYVTNSQDCDDTLITYADNDGDGYGGNVKVPCGVANTGDCDDSKAGVYPGAVEVCGNAVDDNCNGQVDEGCTSISVTIVPSFTPEGDKGTRPMIFIVALNKTAPATVSVKYKTYDGSAKAGSDYQKNEGTVSFSKGQWFKLIVVNVYGDRQLEPDEQLGVQLHTPVNVKINGTGKATGTIINDERTKNNATLSSDLSIEQTPEAQTPVVPNPLRRSQLWRIGNLPAQNQVFVSDVNGRIVMQARNYQNRHSFTNLAPGIYFYRIITEANGKPNIYTGKLMIVD